MSFRRSRPRGATVADRPGAAARWQRSIFHMEAYDGRTFARRQGGSLITRRKALGIPIPQAALRRADEVIQ